MFATPDTTTRAAKELEQRPTLSEFLTQLVHLFTGLRQEGLDVQCQHLSAVTNFEEYRVVVSPDHEVRWTEFHLMYSDDGGWALFTRNDVPFIGTEEVITVLTEEDGEVDNMTEALLAVQRALRSAAADLTD